MKNNFAVNYGRAFVEILFLHPWNEDIRQLNIRSRISLYFLTLLFFYAPIFYFAVKSSNADNELIPYFLVIGAIHILSKIMLYNSKRIQKRFSTIKDRKHFFHRVWFMIEYIVFMWIVYLFFPLTCILVPFSLLGMAFESITGNNVLLNLFLQDPEQFIAIAGIASYILFILADGYKKLKTGFLPDYLGLYALLAVMSAAVEGSTKNILEYFSVDISNVTKVLSEIFSLSNNSMNIVASAMTVFFAIYSLYTNCGTAGESEDQNCIETEIGEGRPNNK